MLIKSNNNNLVEPLQFQVMNSKERQKLLEFHVAMAKIFTEDKNTEQSKKL